MAQQRADVKGQNAQDRNCGLWGKGGHKARVDRGGKGKAIGAGR